MQRNDSIEIRVTKSRLSKGLLSIPSSLCYLFPSARCTIRVAFEDETTYADKTFIPNDSKTKESRLFGLSEWFGKQAVRHGDLVVIERENEDSTAYRIATQRFLLAREERSLRATILGASEIKDAGLAIESLARIVRRKPRDVAVAELKTLVNLSRDVARNTRQLHSRASHAPAMAGVRAMLGYAYEGRCQLCSFTFLKRDRKPYYEVHHIDPERGDDPRNLLVLCANCHAKLTHASVESLGFLDGWLTSIEVNGQHVKVRQLLVEPSLSLPMMTAALIVVLAMEHGWQERLLF